MTDTANFSEPQTEAPQETPPERVPPAPPSRRRSGILLLLLGILLIGAFFRSLNVDWDEGEHLHPDERYMTMVTGAISSPGSQDSFQNPPPGCTAWGGYFNSYCSPLNPYNHSGYGSYAYGTLPLFGARIVGEVLNNACVDAANPDAAPPAPLRWVAQALFDDAAGCTGDLFTNYGHVNLLGRMLATLADLGTLLFTFLIGRRLYGERVGLLAAALYAFTALAIQQAHFYTVDAFAAFFIAVAGYFAVRGAQGGRWRDFTLAGLTFGLALACKVSVWPFAAVIALAALLYYVRRNRPAGATHPSRGVLDWLMMLLLIIFSFLVAAIALFGIWSAVKLAFFFAVGLLIIGVLIFFVRRPATLSRQRVSIDAVATRLVLAGIVAFIGFRVAQPYAFVGTGFNVDKWEASEYDWLRNNVPDIWYTLNAKMPGPLRALLLPDPRFIGTLASVNQQLTGEQDVPWGHQWTNRLPFVFPWVNMVVWGMGLALGLAVWAGWGLAAVDLWRGVRRRQHLIPWAWVTILFFYQGTQWVKSIRYLLPIYPFLIILGAWLLLRLWDAGKARLGRPNWRRLTAAAYRTPMIVVLAGTTLWAWGFSRIYTQPVTRNAASRWMVENIPTAATLHYRAGGADKTLFLQLPPTFTFDANGMAHISSFTLPEDGLVTGITFTHLSDPQLDAEPEGFQVQLSADMEGQTLLAQAERTINLEQTQHRLGDAQDFPFEPVQLRGGQTYYLTSIATAGAPIRMDTTVIANEYPDDSLPTRVDGRDPFGGMYRGLQASGDGKTHWDLNEDASKLSQALDWLDEADIITLSSNRGYASIPRLPSRYPMAIAYYQALFDGELGFDLIATFDAYPTIGPFQFPDQETPFQPGEPSLVKQELGSISISLPPAEEAFSVYDHPQVFLFRKTADYSRQQVEQVLGSVDLDQVVWQKPTEATLAPTALMHTEEELAVQRAGGTWTSIFTSDWLNRAPWLSVLVWWGLVQLLGLIAFPLLFVAAPGLRDRGWPLAKTLGLLALAMVVWLAASTQWFTYSRALILGATLLLAAIGGLLAWWRRGELRTWFARERRAVLVSELLFSGLFLFFLLIRYGNPDLWHPVMGGERPMDFAYLLAVIKSTHFPPYDPWLAGGYMNYYYFGFVIAGTPIKLLGLLPEIAYNLLLPTFFALTGVGAYSVAYNLVSSVGAAKTHEPPSQPAAPGEARRAAFRLGRYAIYAGLIAAIFVMVMGNLTEISLVVDGWQQLGSRDFHFQSTIPGLEPLVVTLRGAVKNSIGGEAMPWRAEWPYWNASRAIPHPDGEAPPITEFPFFTFLYSDLHAHLLVLPLTLLALGLMAHWVLDADFWQLSSGPPGGRRRRWFGALLGLLLGGVTIGALRPTNTWDYVTYLALLPLALTIGYAAHRASAPGSGLDRRTIKAGVAAVGGRFILVAGLSYLLFLPYITRFATGSMGFDLWKGSKTPLWAYFGVYGLFLLPILTWLLLPILDGARVRRALAQRLPEDAWFRRQIQAFSDRANPHPRRLMLGPGLIILVALATLLAVGLGCQVALVVFPFGIVALGIVLAPAAHPAQRLVALLIGVGLALSLWVELAVLNTGDVSRMNTVFKFYMQVWVLFGVTSAVALVWIFQRWRQERSLAVLEPAAAVGDDPPPAAEPLPAIDPVEGEAGDAGPAPASASDAALPLVEGPASAVSAPSIQSLDVGSLASRVWRGALVAFILLAALYPILATRAKINDRWAREIGPGLDSLAWMKAVTDTQFDASNQPHQIPLVWEYDALMWLRDNIQGSPVVAEGAKAQPYRSLRARVATYTGLPIIIGYPWHEKQQHSILKADVVDRRERDVNDLYNTPDPWHAKEILDRYDVQLVYLADLEKVSYDAAGIAKFDRMVEMGLLRQIYSNPGVTIYEVVR